MNCRHEQFVVAANVIRLTESEADDTISGWTTEIKVKCTECGMLFRFLGLSAGVSPNHPMTGIGGFELRAPIAPAFEE